MLEIIQETGIGESLMQLICILLVFGVVWLYRKIRYDYRKVETIIKISRIKDGYDGEIYTKVSGQVIGKFYFVLKKTTRGRVFALIAKRLGEQIKIFRLHTLTKRYEFTKQGMFRNNTPKTVRKKILHKYFIEPIWEAAFEMLDHEDELEFIVEHKKNHNKHVPVLVWFNRILTPRYDEKARV